MVALAGASVGACEGPLSILDPAGPAAAAIARLWWIMLGGAAAILALVLGLLAYAFRRSDRVLDVEESRWVIGGGIAFPSVTLLALLLSGVATGEWLLPKGDPSALQVEALASRFQWAFRHPDRLGAEPLPVLVIPAGRAVDVHVSSTDVIHSFWVPRLGPKIDAVPGHVNVIRIAAEAPGIYRGQCSEFCGRGHAAMHFYVEALPAEEFARWIAASGRGDLQGIPRAAR